MYKNDYLESLLVNGFIDWISNKLDEPNSFVHTYHMKKPFKSWECTSIYSAYENYIWRQNSGPRKWEVDYR